MAVSGDSVRELEPVSSLSSESASRSIVVLGAGVIGLTIAYVLSEVDGDGHPSLTPNRPASKITVVARELPIPEHLSSQGWASPWAGANWSPLGAFDERKFKWEKATVEKLWSMIPSGLVMELPSRLFYTDTDSFNAEPWWKDIVRDFRVIPESELPEAFQAGLAFTTVSLRPVEYLNWLREELVKRGVTFIHKSVASIEEAAAIGGSDSIVVNATGLGSKSLLGVEDENVYPIRGQTIVVDAPQVREFIAVSPSQGTKLSTESTYIIPRPDGTSILGGTYQEDNFDVAVDHRIARRIFERCTALQPGLQLSRGAKIQSLNVGLRPARRGGPRVELESVRLPLKTDLIPLYDVGQRTQRELKVIHAYGLGPAGYQASWGVAKEVENILARI